MDKNNKFFKRTTLWLPIELHTQAKIFAILSNTSFSNLIRSALKDKIDKLKENNEKLK